MVRELADTEQRGDDAEQLVDLRQRGIPGDRERRRASSSSARCAGCCHCSSSARNAASVGTW